MERHSTALDPLFAEIATEAGENAETLKRTFFEKIKQGEAKTDEK